MTPPPPREPPREPPLLPYRSSREIEKEVARELWGGLALIFGSVAAIAVIMWAAFPARAEPRAHPCRDGLIELVEKGDVLACGGHLVQSETLAFYQAAVDERDGLKVQVEKLNQQLASERAATAEERDRGEALLKVCENARTAAEAAKAPPKCPRASLLGRPEFAWPTALAVGFFGGVAFDRWGVGCR